MSTIKTANLPFDKKVLQEHKTFMSNWRGDKIRNLRENNGLTLDDLAEKSGLNRDHIGRIERGEQKDLRESTLNALAKGLGVSPSLLQYSDDVLEAVGKASQETSWHELHEVPLLIGTVEAGDFQKDFSQWAGDTIPIPESRTQGLVAWRVRGQSMEPKYVDGDLVIINRLNGWQSGDDVIAERDGDEITIKKLKMLDDGSVELRPYNENYPTRLFKSGDKIKILGVVVGRYTHIKRRKK